MNEASKRFAKHLFDNARPASSASRREEELSAMERSIQENFRRVLGEDVRFSMHSDLLGYRCGRLLTIEELEAMPNGTVIWVRYEQHGESEPRVDGPYRITRVQGRRAWMFDDGSSFGCDYEHRIPCPVCTQEVCGEGQMFLHHAIQGR